MADTEELDPIEALKAIHEKQIQVEEETPPIDPHSIVDVNGNPLKYGNDDPNVIGPDDAPPVLESSFRQRRLYPEHYPEALFLMEENWVLPMAAYLTEHVLGLDQLIDETSYRKVQLQLRQRYIFSVIDLSDIVVRDGVVTWEGYKIWCKQWMLASITFRLDIRLNLPSIQSIKLWRSKPEKYVHVGDPQGTKMLTREEAVTVITNYIAMEGIFG